MRTRSTSRHRNGSLVDRTTPSPDNRPDEGLSRSPSPRGSTRNVTQDLEEAHLDGIDKLYPIAPNDVVELKYYRFEHYPMEDDDETMMMIEPHQRAFERENVPSGWKAHVCPEGKLYFAHETMRVVTLTNIQEPEYYERIMAVVHELYPQMPENSPEVELLVQCTWADGVPVMGYYFADWENRIIFWLRAVKHTLITKGERCPVSRPHLQLAMHSEFGLHVEMFCAHRVLPLTMVEEVKDSFESGAVDVITSDQSMFSYDAETANRIVRILDRVPKKATINRHTSWIVGRSYKTLYSDRYLAFYGESGARCSRSDNAFENTGFSHRTLFVLISFPLFLIPFAYLKRLDSAFVDQTVHSLVWRRFVDVLKRDWENSITLATVLLTANIGFLAIQSIDNTGVSGNKSAAQIASYISVILTLFVYISCHILTRRHRRHEAEQSCVALRFLATRRQRPLGLPAVALAYSLPIALFIWSMISFLVAMVTVFFGKTNLATKATLGAILGVLIIITMVLLYLEWDNAAPRSGFSIFWWELKKHVRLLLIIRPKKCAKRHSDADSNVTDARYDIGDEVECTTARAGESSPNVSKEERGSASSQSQRFEGSTLSALGLTKRGWQLRWPLGWRDTRTDSADVAAEMATLPMHSVQPGLQV